MTNFTVNLGGIVIAIEGNSPEEIAQTLRDNNLETLLYNNFYFSKSTQQRTGEGWIRLEDMNDVFIVNSFAARLSETIRGMYKSVKADGSDLAAPIFASFLQDLATSVEYNSVIPDPIGNHPILLGLVNELNRRLIEDTLNNEFDEDNDDVVVSDTTEELTSSELYYTNSSAGLSFLDRS